MGRCGVVLQTGNTESRAHCRTVKRIASSLIIRGQDLTKQYEEDEKYIGLDHMKIVIDTSNTDDFREFNLVISM